MVARCVVQCVRCPGHLAPVHRWVRSVPCSADAVSRATWLLFTCVPARCVVLRAWCPELLGSCAPVRPLRPLLCSCGVLGELAPVHQCACWVCCVAPAASWATWLLFTSVPARCVMLGVRCPGPLGCCTAACPLRLLLCWCSVLATWLLFIGVPARCVVLGVRCPRATWLLFTGASPRCVALLMQCPRPLCCDACAMSWATWLLFTGVPALCVVFRVRCPGPLGSC